MAIMISIMVLVAFRRRFGATCTCRSYRRRGGLPLGLPRRLTLEGLGERRRLLGDDAEWSSALLASLLLVSVLLEGELPPPLALPAGGGGGRAATPPLPSPPALSSVALMARRWRMWAGRGWGAMGGEFRWPLPLPLPAGREDEA